MGTNMGIAMENRLSYSRQTTFVTGLKCWKPANITSCIALVMFILALLLTQLQAATVFISGNIRHDTTWVDTVVIDSMVEVGSGATLVIAPGSRVRVSRNTALKVHGRLLAEGTQQDSITFCGASGSSPWYGIRFFDVSSTSDTSRLSFCHIERAEPEHDNIKGNWGGGITFKQWSKVVIMHSTITKCGGSGSGLYGGGVLCKSSSPLFYDCRLLENSMDCAAGYGSAIYLEESSPTLINCIFDGNTIDGAGVEGAGLDCNQKSSPLLINCLFTGNSSDGAGEFGGALVLNNNSNARLINCTIAKNGIVNQKTDGQAVYMYKSSPQFTNCIIALSGNADRQITASDSSCHPKFINCLIDSAIRPRYYLVDTSGFYTQTIFGNPFFTNSSSKDFRPGAHSACINAGTADTTGLRLPQSDLAGCERIYDGRVDIGAYEYQAEVLSSIINGIKSTPHHRSTTICLLPIVYNRSNGSTLYCLDGRFIHRCFQPSGTAYKPVVKVPSHNVTDK
jgi:hypothetical protein